MKQKSKTNQSETLDQSYPNSDMKIKKKTSRFRVLIIVFLSIILFFAFVIAVFFIWYRSELRPVSDDVQASHVRITIEPGMNPDQIANLLYEKKLIRNSSVFSLYSKLSGVHNTIQVGTFNISPNYSTQQITQQITSIGANEFSLTFLPGSTIMDNRKVLINAGYSADLVDKALNKTYDNPVFIDKPSGASLEGYIYGETYNFSSSATPEDILERTFDELNKQIRKNNLIDLFKQKNLNLHEGIIMASIIQREVSSIDSNNPSKDQEQVSQVFHSRLKLGMSLGADSTAYYGADIIGIDRSVKVDTAYNTRIYKGLPIGPIASPGLGALKAAASPANGNYLFFVSGDDGINYFSYTNEEHEENTAKYCHLKCASP